MFFKNLYFFALTRPFEWSQEQLENQLKEVLFTPCASTEQQHFGFIKALGKYGSSLIHEVNGNVLMCARKEEKILPAPVINDELSVRIEALEAEQSRTATKKEREQLKEDIIFELLPRAFSRITDTHGYINAEQNIIVINASSRGKAEDFLSLLRKALGTLPVTSISPERAPDEVMTDWVNENSEVEEFAIKKPFKLGCEAEFNALGDDGAIVRVKNQDLDSDEVKAHLEADKYIVKIALEWDDSMSFILNDDLSIKRLKFFDVLQEQNDDIDSDDVLAKLDADFALMAGEINRMIQDLLSNFSVKATDYLEGEHEEIIDEVGDEIEPLYEEAKAFVIEEQRASTSGIQRKFRIGYNRAARIVESLEANKIVSPPNHNGVREVLIKQ